MIRYDLDPATETATVTLDRPAKKNALTLDGLDDLRSAFERAADEARVAVLRSAGDAFCAGDDIATVAGLGSSVAVDRFGDLLYEALFGAEQVGVPVVAAVDGLAYGGGFELVAAADLAVATTDATFALPETRIGAFPPYALSRVADICGRKRLLELVLTGEPVDAATAREWGLVNRVVDPDRLDAAVEEYVDAVRESPAGAVRLAKRHVDAGRERRAERDRLVDGFARVAADEECLEAARAFLDR